MDDFKSFEQFQKEKSAGEQLDITNTGKYDAVQNEPDGSFPQEYESSGKKRHSKIHLKPGAYVILFCLFVLLILLSLLFLPIPFGYVNVYNTSSITLEDVLFDGNVRSPVNVLQISTSDLEERLGHDLRVQEVHVARESPFSIGVDITESRPVAVVQGEFLYIVLDETGRVIESESSIKQLNVPFITGKKLGNVLLGQTVTDIDIQKGLLFIKSLSLDGEKIFSEVNIGNPYNITAYTRGGVTVHLGKGENIDEQAALAENMVGDIKARGLSVEYIDANTSSPFIKLSR